ncbi:MAG: oxygen-independent coproporphyrinogen III oxidase [Gammaproteobacteria bacterium]
MDTAVVFNSDLINRYDKAGPRYTSYPTAVQFHTGYTAADYRRLAQASNSSGRPLSLYFHIPFCDTVCFYCACSKIITKNRRRAVSYLEHLYREIALQGALFDSSRPVRQLHWGGGTPTFISTDQMRELMAVTGRHFQLLDDDSGEYSIEIDPREVTPESIHLLRELGFNRISMGVQDFDPQVQQAVNRIQSRYVTERAIQAARDEGFKSISLDLIYGLPLQTVASFDRTLNQILALEPDRLSVFNYAHLPAMFKTQRQIRSEELPSPAVKLEILQHVIRRLIGAGYVYIGMDHFAKPDDELAQAQRNGTLYRNFQGYSTHADCDLVAMGMTAIGKVGDSYSQNVKTLDEYYSALERDELPVFRGVHLNHDDLLRRTVINRLICNFTLNTVVIEDEFNLRFSEYFQPELKQLAVMQGDGLVRLRVDGIDVLPPGRLLIRNICMVFDHYLRQQTEQRFSRAI